MIASCGSDTNAPPTIEAVTPPYGPLQGGTRLVITGTGFLADGAQPNRVLIGGVEAPLASAVDDQTLEVLLPPSATPGDRAVVVYNRNGYVSESGKFNYSALPAITAAQPARLEYNKTTRVVLTGSGFVADDAGIPKITVDGVAATDIKITSDTSLSFQIGPGLPLSQPDIKLQNTVGEATASGLLQYVPTLGKGFILFSKSNNNFAAFFDPVSRTLVDIPNSPKRRTVEKPGFRALFVDAAGNYWAHTRSSTFGQIEFGTQNIDKSVRSGARVIAFERVGSDIYAIARGGQFGRFNITTGEFAPIGASLIPGGTQCGLALLGPTMFATCGGQIMSINVTTGALGPQVAISPPTVGGEVPHFADVRVLDGILYGVTRDGQIVTINPTTGITGIVEEFGISVTAMELFQ
ncbi:MAG: IPT/TIG domain-containing protein [Kofleriaceae bacterium]|nr:IPT/TIG domain-containing protein [Kofleriaceae bacterium]